MVIPIYFKWFYFASFKKGNYLNGLVDFNHNKINIEHTFDKSKSRDSASSYQLPGKTKELMEYGKAESRDN